MWAKPGLWRTLRRFQTGVVCENRPSAHTSALSTGGCVQKQPSGAHFGTLSWGMWAKIDLWRTLQHSQLGDVAPL